MSKRISDVHLSVLNLAGVILDFVLLNFCC